MFDNSFITNSQNASRVAPATKTKPRTERTQPSATLDIPGFPEYEASYWVAPEDSRTNPGEIFAGVYRVGKDSKGRRKVYRTYPLKSGGLFASILGTCELLGHFVNEPTLSEADRRLYLDVAVDVSEVLYKHLDPRGNQRTADAQAVVTSVRDVSRNVLGR